MDGEPGVLLVQRGKKKNLMKGEVQKKVGEKYMRPSRTHVKVLGEVGTYSIRGGDTKRQERCGNITG